MPFAMKSVVSSVRNLGFPKPGFASVENVSLPVLLPGRLAARLAKLPKGSDHEQILSMFANTAFWSLAGILFVVLVV